MDELFKNLTFNCLYISWIYSLFIMIVNKNSRDFRKSSEVSNKRDCSTFSRLSLLLSQPNQDQTQRENQGSG